MSDTIMKRIEELKAEGKSLGEAISIVKREAMAAAIKIKEKEIIKQGDVKKNIDNHMENIKKGIIK